MAAFPILVGIEQFFIHTRSGRDSVEEKRLCVSVLNITLMENVIQIERNGRTYTSNIASVCLRALTQKLRTGNDDR